MNIGAIWADIWDGAIWDETIWSQEAAEPWPEQSAATSPTFIWALFRR